jgi:hypothetical protein
VNAIIEVIENVQARDVNVATGGGLVGRSSNLSAPNVLPDVSIDAKIFQ